MIKNYLAKQKQQANDKQQNAPNSALRKVVKCRFCDLHLPQEDAVEYDTNSFCSQSHKQAWLEKNH